jgi:hypothetical protein
MAEGPPFAPLAAHMRESFYRAVGHVRAPYIVYDLRKLTAVICGDATRDIGTSTEATHNDAYLAGPSF